MPYWLQAAPVNASGGFPARVLPRAVLTLGALVERLVQEAATWSALSPACFSPATCHSRWMPEGLVISLTSSELRHLRAFLPHE